MDSQTYWRKREAEALKHYITEEAEYDKQINKIYTNMLANCQKEINAFYGRYADKEGITIAEAKKRVSSMDIKAYEAKAERYVKDREFSKQANEEMRLYNATMRINRLEMLKANIGLELIAGSDDLEKFMEGVLKGRTEAELARQAGILGKTIKNNAELSHSIVNSSFHNATFSDRIWNNSAAMKADLDKLIQSGMIQGKNANVLAKDLQKYFIGEPRLKNGKKGAKYRAEVLMRTELARVQTEAQKQSFIRNGFDKYMFITNSSCCGLCEEVVNKDVGFGKGIFLVEDMMPGENAAPVHPLCRCSIAAYSDRAEYEEWLSFLESGGTTQEWEELGVKKSIYNYMSSQSYVVNEALRNKKTLSKEEKKFVYELDKALKELPTYEGNLQRSLFFYSDDDITLFMKDYEIDKSITFKEYISTTKGETYNPEGQVQIFIQNSKKGRDISTFNEKESEVLYERNSAFIVRNVKEHDGKYYILLEEDNE